jgi:ribonuclease R
MKIERLNEMLKPFGIQSPINSDNTTGFMYQKLLANVPQIGNVGDDGTVVYDNTLKQIVSQLALRSMQKAKYSENCVGHFGLGSKYYCHFTSPIRRYPDLVVHRIIKQMICNKLSSHKIIELQDTVKAAAEQSTKTELIATEVEREIDNLKRAEYMNDHIGEKFTGTISGIQEFGVFVYLPNTVEGLVKIENLPKKEGSREYYTFNEKNFTMSSKARTLKMGDKMEVTCIGVNLARRQIEFKANQDT